MRTVTAACARLAVPLLALVGACSNGTGDERSPRELPYDGRAEEADDPAVDVAAPEIPEGAPTIAFLGDSITAGLHLPAHQAFPSVVQRALAEDGLPFHLVDGGVSGDTAAGGRRRIAWLLRSEPDVVVVELGGNDGLRGLELGRIEDDLRAIVATAREAGAVPLLLGMRLPPSLGQEYTEDFAAMYDRIAEDMGVAYVPFFMEGVGGVPEMNLRDELHPNPEGHRRLAERLAEPLAELLRELDE